MGRDPDLGFFETAECRHRFN